MKKPMAIAFLPIFAAAGPAGQPVAELWTPPAISSAGYESSPTFSPDGREMYFFRADRSFSNYQLLVSRCEDGAWGKPVMPDFARPLPVLEADPAFSPDGNSLYFVSSRHRNFEPGREELDIFVTTRRADGAWSNPAPLAGLASAGSELLPRPHGKSIYFGSDREGGLGKSDIWRAQLHPNGSWTTENLGAPVNSEASDYEADISRDGKILVVVSDREGRSHLYVFRLVGTRWMEAGRIAAREDVFQVGPLISPKGDRLLFAQAHDDDSGEFFVVDLEANADHRWPPRCAER
jgi:Tol biopolymer transport system component